MAAKTFKEGGKGRKQCPRCKVYVAANLAACPACHKLFDGVEVEEENEPIVLPEATRTQPPAKKAQKKQTGKSTAPTWTMRITGLRIPDGNNPVPLRGKDKASLLKWAEAVRAHWMLKQYWLLKEGLCYYLLWESLFEDNEKALDAACKIINDNLTNDRPEGV